MNAAVMMQRTGSADLSTKSATCLKSSSVKPREVRAGAPMRSPPGIRAEVSPASTTSVMVVSLRYEMQTVTALLCCLAGYKCESQQQVINKAKCFLQPHSDRE